MKKQKLIPLQWSITLENACKDRLFDFENKLLDKKRIQNVIQARQLNELLMENGGSYIQNAIEALDIKTSFGFEVILMLLLDDQNDDRFNRRLLLNRNARLFGMSQISHSQYDYINSVIVCQSMNSDDALGDITILHDRND